MTTNNAKTGGGWGKKRILSALVLAMKANLNYQKNGRNIYYFIYLFIYYYFFFFYSCLKSFLTSVVWLPFRCLLDGYARVSKTLLHKEVIFYAGGI